MTRKSTAFCLGLWASVALAKTRVPHGQVVVNICAMIVTQRRGRLRSRQ